MTLLIILLAYVAVGALAFIAMEYLTIRPKARTERVVFSILWPLMICVLLLALVLHIVQKLRGRL